jgi:hypothetical protein
MYGLANAFFKKKPLEYRYFPIYIAMPRQSIARILNM